MRDELRTTVVASGRGMTRREMLKGLGFGVGVTVLLSGCVVPSPSENPMLPPAGFPDLAPFLDGVMSGDPSPNGALIWTRVEPNNLSADVPVLWTVAEDSAFNSIRSAGLVTATAAEGYAVTVAVDGLDPHRWYYYRFEAADQAGTQVASRFGRIRTAPAVDSSPDRLRFAFASCQQINDSWFNAHSAAASEPDLDFFMHLGDYVYVSDTGTLTREDYRQTYQRWRKQPLLRDLHAALPTVAMWDDGEFYNGISKTGPADRLTAAKQAWFEAFPILDPGGFQAYRRFAWGDLVDLSMIDVRTYRDDPIENIVYTSNDQAYEPGRSTLGAEQYEWFTQGLAASEAAWRVVGNPYNISPWKLINLEFLRAFRPDLPPNAGIYAPNEAWDDYLTERRDLLQFLIDSDVTDTVFASGHTHVALVSELRADYDKPSTPVAAFDFCTGSLTADPDPRKSFLGDLPVAAAEEVLRAAERFVLNSNAPALRHMNLVDQGYTVVDITPEEMLVTIRNIDTTNPDAEAVDGARFRVRKGAQRIEVLPTPTRKGSFA
ncbi:MAG: alkaline phosphatase D family protein [Microthrixaceae bacterium]